MHEGVEGIVEGVHEVGVVDRRLSACKYDHFDLALALALALAKLF